MGRIAAYLGPRTKVSSIVEAGSYSLLRQAEEFPDGFGLAWYPEPSGHDPLRLSARGPIWSEPEIMGVARHYSSHCAMAGIEKLRGTIPERSKCQPFQSGPHLFAHSGELEGFSKVFERPLRQRLSASRAEAIKGTTPSELLFANWLELLGDVRGPEAMANALEALAGAVFEIASRESARLALSIVVSDGSCLVTLRAATPQAPSPTLYTMLSDGAGDFPATGRIVASEPLFAGAWAAIEPNSLLIFTTER